MLNADRAAIRLKLQLVPIQQISTLFRAVPRDAIDPEAVEEDGMALCDLVLRRVRISGRESGPSQSPAGPSNEYSPGMHKRTYYERHPTDRMLNFGPTVLEWSRLMFTLLGIAHDSPKAESFTGLQDEIPGFPMLSRIAGP